jgi:hypothetical protein
MPAGCSRSLAWALVGLGALRTAAGCRSAKWPRRCNAVAVRKQASEEVGRAHSSLVPSDRLAGTAGDARISERAGAESRKGVPYIHGL